MLKDLDKRQSEQQASTNVSVPVSGKTSTTKLILIIIAIIAVVNVIGVVGWQLYSENQQLKLQAQQEKLAKIPPRHSTKPLADTETKQYTDPELKHASQIKTEIFEREENIASVRADLTLPNVEDSKSNTTKNGASKANAVDDFNKTLIEKSQVTRGPVSTEVANGITKADNTQEVLSTDIQSSLTISRSQLSPQALAANKINQAEQAMEINDIAKAESLFEEVLMVMPEHETARKQLAALWYGKKYYQDAINLLSQGIALAPQAEEMRLMSARIYYEQDNARQAYNILTPINGSNSTEVQMLLANIAAALNEHESAILAYQKLVTLEPDVGRWWLGVAVSLDSLGKFVPARDAYKQSIARNNLSTSAMLFAQQRLTELGE